MKFFLLILGFLVLLTSSCDKTETPISNDILGFELLSDLNGHWVGSNETAFGFYDWFAFDFRPISASHSHSIYEGGTNQNIINSVFIGEKDGSQKLFARNGGWLGDQYRATYFVLDIANINQTEKYYRLVDAVGGEDRAYIEYKFKEDSIFFDAYKDNSGSLDKPILHMSFKGVNRNPSYSQNAIQHFNYPMVISEVNFENAFENLIDPDSALFLEEENDPFPKNEHGYLSDVTIDLIRSSETLNQSLLLYIAKEELVSSAGLTNTQNIENSVIRTIDIQDSENEYYASYLHPDTYYFTVFLDKDNNGYPSVGDISSVSVEKTIISESQENVEVQLNLTIQ